MSNNDRNTALFVLAMLAFAAVIGWFVYNNTHGGIDELCNRDATCNGNLICAKVPERGYRCQLGGVK